MQMNCVSYLRFILLLDLIKENEDQGVVILYYLNYKVSKEKVA